MKLAQEVRAGNVIMIGSNPMVVQKAEFTKSGRNASVVKMKMKNLLSGSGTNLQARRQRCSFRLQHMDADPDGFATLDG